MSNVEQVGARMVLLDGDKFRADLAASTASMKAFNDEQERTATLAKSTAATVADASATQATASTAAAEDSAVAAEASAKRVGAAAVAGTTALEKATKASNKILKWGSLAATAVVYEGIKNFNAFQQMISQTAIDAGIKKSQLPAFSKMAIEISNSTGLAATSVADMMYRIASANPKIGTTTAAMKAMATQAANLYVLSGATGNYDSIARTYGAIVSSGIPLTQGGKPLNYSSASAKAINELVLATVGHGDMKTGDLVSALGTGLLPVAATYGVSANQIAAGLDIMSPAMNASAASTRLKTAIGMLGSPSQKTAQAMELIGGNGTTLSGLLRSKGLGGALSYLASLSTKTFAGSAFVGGGIFGAASGKYSGSAGAADFLKAYGFTNSGLVSLLQSQGTKGLLGMSSTQLQGLGFTKGLTGSQAAKTITSDLIGTMFGGGHTGAAIMQLINAYESGNFQRHVSAITSSDTGKSGSTYYEKAMRIAYHEPIVAFNKFKAQLQNLTITVGKDVTPAFDDFLHTLESIGSYLGHEKGLLAALGIGAGALVTGAVGVKGYNTVQKITSFVTGAGSGKSATTAYAEVTKGGLMLQRASLALAGDDAKLGLGASGLVADDATGMSAFGKLGLLAGVGVAAYLGNVGAHKAQKNWISSTPASWLGLGTTSQLNKRNQSSLNRQLAASVSNPTAWNAVIAGMQGWNDSAGRKSLGLAPLVVPKVDASAHTRALAELVHTLGTETDTSTQHTTDAAAKLSTAATELQTAVTRLNAVGPALQNALSPSSTFTRSTTGLKGRAARQ